MGELTTRNYSSNYSVKDFIKNDIGVNYFNFDQINALNIGTFGFLTDVEASQAEDTSNIISTYAKEIFPNLAEIPESIYSYAGLYQVNDLMAIPSMAGVMLFINESSIIKYGERKGEVYEFYIGSALSINVNGFEFSPDYDIKITYRKYRDELVFSAMYDVQYKNSLSDINNPYIKIKRISFKGENYLGLIMKVRSVTKSEIPETLISNDKINLPKVKFNYHDQLCNFEVLYRAPESEVYTQLEKRFYMAEPSKNPFCYFRLTDSNEVELSFTSRDGCFQPKFNSEILIKVYTCNGAEDNFPLYKGDNITVQPAQMSKYAYNQNVIMMAIIQTKSFNGTNMPTLKEIQQLYLEKMITMDSYTTENDLQIYFNKIKNMLGNDINFIKKRDDIFERLFCAFSLMKDYNGDIYHTNTLNLRIDDKSILDTSGSAYLLKPGKVFRYLENKRDTCEIDTELTLWDEPVDKNDFLYTCPFLVYVQKNPENVFYFYNSINEDVMLDYNYSNANSYVQFICSTLKAFRNSTIGEDSYKFRVELNPSVENYKAIIDEEGNETGALKVKMVFPNTAGSDTCSIDLHLVESDISRHIYTYEGELKTNDVININNEMTVSDVYNIDSQDIRDSVIPMNTKFKLLTLFDYGDDTDNRHRFSSMDDIANFTLTNIYTNDPDQTLDLMVAVPNCRSKITFLPKGENAYYINLSSLPLLSTSVIHDMPRFQYFIDSLKSQYHTVTSLMQKITNNYSIDMKLYNTYGRSNNFVLGEDETKLDRVNCSIKFKVSPTLGTDEVKLVSKIKSLIKTYIESINKNGYNGIYISNLIKHLESNISEIAYLKFICINEYDSMVQVIDNRDINIATASKDELKNYIPEFLTIDINDINIEIITSNSKTTN